MSLVTVSMLGLQLVWCVGDEGTQLAHQLNSILASRHRSTEMSQASPYLLSLGLSKSLMAMVFLAGPLSGQRSVSVSTPFADPLAAQV